MTLLQVNNPGVSFELSDFDHSGGCPVFTATFVHHARTISTQNGWKVSMFNPAATKGDSAVDANWPLEHADDLPGEPDVMRSFAQG